MRYLDADYTEQCVVNDFRVVRREESKNLRIRTRTLRAQRWDATIALRGEARLRRDVLRDQRVKGLGTPFALPMPQDVKSIGVGQPRPTGTLNVRAAADAGAGTVRVSVAGGAKPIYNGWYIRFSSHRKVYEVVSDDGEYGGTPKDLEIYPALVEDVAQSQTVVLEPDLWCVYNPGLTFGSRETADETAYYAAFNVSEYLE